MVVGVGPRVTHEILEKPGGLDVPRVFRSVVHEGQRPRPCRDVEDVRPRREPHASAVGGALALGLGSAS